MKLSQIAAVAALSLTASLASASAMAPDASGWNNKTPAAEPQRVGGPVQVHHRARTRTYIPEDRGIVLQKAPAKQKAGGDWWQAIASNLGSGKNNLSQNSILRQHTEEEINQSNQPAINPLGS
jgi:hypothetical protein